MYNIYILPADEGGEGVVQASHIAPQAVDVNIQPRVVIYLLLPPSGLPRRFELLLIPREAWARQQLVARLSVGRDVCGERGVFIVSRGLNRGFFLFFYIPER